MSEAMRIRKNSLFSFLSMSSRLFTNIVIYWIIARFYGREIFGQFTSAQTIAIALILFADFGLDLLLTTELPRDISKSVGLFNKYFSIKLILSSIAFIIMLLFSSFGSFGPEVKKLLAIFSFFVVFTTLSNFLTALYKGNEKLEYEAFVNFIINFNSLVVILILIAFKQNIIIISLAFTLTKLIGLIASFYFAHKLLPLNQVRIDFTGFRLLKNQVITFGLFWVFGNLFFQLDTILLAFWQGEKSVGTYQSVFRLIMLPLVIPDIFVNSLMPTLSRLNSENELVWKKLGSLFNKLLVLIAIPLSITFYIYSDQIIHLVYGKKEYSDAIPILRIFAIILFIRFFSETHGLMLTTSLKQKTRMKIVVVATFLNFIINYFLISKYGAFGAGLTSLITNLFVCVFYVAATFSFTKLWFVNLNLITLLIFVLIFTLSELFLNEVGLWYLCLISILTYMVFVYKKNSYTC